MSLSPCVDQTEEEIARYYRNVELGALAAVRHTQGHILRYELFPIEGLNPARGRVYLKQAGAFYMKRGKNCFHPMGQTSLVVPTPEVQAWAKQNPQGAMGF